ALRSQPECTRPDRLVEMALLELDPDMSADLGHHKKALLLESAERHARQRPVGYRLIGVHGFGIVGKQARDSQFQTAALLRGFVVNHGAAVLAVIRFCDALCQLRDEMLAHAVS